MKTLFRCALRIFSREFWTLPVADPAAPFLRLVMYAWGAMFVLVYSIPIGVLIIGGVVIEHSRYSFGPPLIWSIRILAVCAGLTVLLPVFWALCHWRMRSLCARALRAVALHQATCLACLAPLALLTSMDSSFLNAGVPFLALFTPQLLHWGTLGVYFLPGLILIIAFYVAGGGALPGRRLPGWRLPALALFLAVASSVPGIAWFPYMFL